MEVPTLSLLESVTRRQLERKQRGQPVTIYQLERAVRTLLDRSDARFVNGAKPFSLCRLVRGLVALRGSGAIEPKMVEEDVGFVRALSPQTPTGSYLVPTLQADAIVRLLADISVARQIGAVVWPMVGVQKLRVPAALTAPTFEFIAPNSTQTAADPTFAQVQLDLVRHQALIVVSRQLFRSAVPAFDILLEEFFADGMAESEGAAMFSTTPIANGPTALMTKTGITKVLVGGSQNGGTAVWSDWWGLWQTSAETKVRPPLVWVMSPRTLGRLFSMDYASSRPLLTPISPTLPAQAHYELFGVPIFVTTGIGNTDANGSGSSQSHAILMPARSVHIGESGAIDMSLATQSASVFESDQVALRIGHDIAFDYVPAAAIHVLAGVN